MKIVQLPDFPQYAKTVANYIYDTLYVSLNLKTTREELLEVYLTMKKDSMPMTLIALNNNVCIGAVSLIASDLHTRPELSPWLSSLYVRPEDRKKGIGQQLIDAIKKIALKMGYTSLYLRTEGAANYYKKLGWTFLFHTTDSSGIETDIFQLNLEK
jgi:GNAT superfamily N-acetyltransferase